ncbi:hypothetical protein [Rhizobium rhizogenes]|uniref:hypothetical protein n=1 Tax=Rhizobium rhizogenes TaxID=359 RepID=UPI00103EE956|nr:hypothetical protein [Rhizobium rhizogenes]NTG71244.1 hypothetical protein [Rhizobium rhizogenes]NTG90551.1 hypothetical protein [Rhizobium rhizogenes]TRB03354.1 hypothetical protein EXN67_28930 [Rhizobium rhizogenes]TRB38096.1 hypothetical protein EXN73_28495 [Rhizobium rhizogenes]TRB53107.1 hypothetical protein EXN71_28480 [Rhizobium rhizogenes]
MNYTKALFFIVLTTLSSCTEKKPCDCDIKLVTRTPLQNALFQETYEKGISVADIKRCFGNPVMNLNRRPIYIVRDTRKTDGRYCHVGFLFSVPNKPSMMEMSPTSVANWDSDDCDLRALACLRPEAAAAIAAKYGRTIDQAPIPRH